MMTTPATDKSVRDAFIDQKKPEWVGFKAPNEEKLERTTRIEFFRSNTPLADPKPKPKGYRSWQADHVQDLGYFTCIASKENPEGVSETAWRTIQDAILGEEDVRLSQVHDMDSLLEPLPN